MDEAHYQRKGAIAPHGPVDAQHAKSRDVEIAMAVVAKKIGGIQ